VLLQIPDVAIEPAHRIDPCWIAQETCVIAQQRSAHGSALVMGAEPGASLDGSLHGRLSRRAFLYGGVSRAVARNWAHALY
jgi:hypothetical protein